MTATTPETTVETLPYKNPDLPASERIADLLSRMTLEEKVGQMMQLDARGGDLDELIGNKHTCTILHTHPAYPPRAGRPSPLPPCGPGADKGCPPPASPATAA